MSDYIRRQDVLKGKKTGTFANGICFVAEPCVTVEFIESIEPADVVPVIRCRECKHFSLPHACWHDDGMVTAQKDGFCSYGERKE